MSRTRLALRRLAALTALSTAAALVTLPAAAGPDVAQHAATPAVETEGAVFQTANDTGAAPVVTEVAGADRFATAIAVSQRAFTDPGAVNDVVVAFGFNYPDALAGAVLAKRLGGPILLVGRDTVSAAVLDEISRLDPDNVHVLGGTAAVSQAVEDRLDDDSNVVRIAGDTRFATSAAIARATLDVDGNGTVEIDEQTDTVFIVHGIDANPTRGWPDAVSAAWIAAQMGAPILPVRTGSVPSEISAAIAEIGATKAVIVGGEAAVSADVVTELVAAGIDEDEITRLAGDDRYATSAAVYDWAVARGAGIHNRWVATGRNFPDALVAGAAVAALGDSFLLINTIPAASRTVTYERLVAALDQLHEAVVLGGLNAVSQQVRDEIAEAISPSYEAAAFCLTILHNNDGESNVLPSSSGYGGLAGFATVMLREQAAAVSGSVDGCATRGVISVTSGDNFLAGPELSASNPDAAPGSAEYDEKVLDAIAIDYLGYDALDLGNHDFDFGPDLTARFISSFESDAVFLSANLDFSAEPLLDALVDDGSLAKSTVVETGGTKVGIIGLTTPTLRSISSPRGVVVGSEIVNDVTTEVTALEAAGAKVIVLISHLQGIDEDLALIGDLSGVDVVVAGGGDEVLALKGTPLVPGDEGNVYGQYPLAARDSDDVLVPVVTTAGDYKYLGRLVTRFDASGALVSQGGVDVRSSRMLRVAVGDQPDAVALNSFVQTNVVDPIVAFTDELATDVIGTTEVSLGAPRPDIRIKEMAVGNLMADALADVVVELGTDFGIDTSDPIVGLSNGGGLRNNGPEPLADATLTALDTFGIAPFPNFVAAFEDVTSQELVAMLEHAYSDVEGVNGRFAHLSGLVVEVDLSATAGSRVLTVTVDDDRDGVTDGNDVVLFTRATSTFSAQTVTVATIDFLARGGDAYPVPDRDFTVLGRSYQQALRTFIEVDLAGTVPDAAPYSTLDDDEGRLRFTNRG